MIKSAAGSSGIVYRQWSDLSNPKGDPTEFRNLLRFFEQLCSSAELPSLWEVQLGAVAVSYRRNIFAYDANAAESIEVQVTANVRTAIAQFFEARMNGSLKGYTPIWTKKDPLSNPPEVLADFKLTWPDFLKDVDGFLQNSQTDQLKIEGGIADHIYSALFPSAQKMYNTPPPVRLTVDMLSPGFDASSNTYDVNDEIAGHIVLTRRGSAVGEASTGGAEWRCLNWVRCSVQTSNGNGSEGTPLDSPFVIPAFLAEISEARRPFLQLTNEKLSVIAGHQTFPDPDQQAPGNSNGDQSGDTGIHYYFDPDPQHLAKAFWYGYYYDLAGFVALNTGALPGFLCDGARNLPKQTFGNDDLSDAFIKHYQHLRRVPIRPVGAEVTPALVPESLLPIAKELAEWWPNEEHQEQHWFLLAEETDQYTQKALSLILSLPTTTFWDWYAWKGADATPQERMEALTRDIQSRVDATSGKNRVSLKPLTDPAAEKRLVFVIEQLFPENKEVDVLSVDASSEDKISLTIQLDASIETVTPLPDKSSITVKAPPGCVFRIKVSAAIRKEVFTLHGAQQKFYDWMRSTMNLEPDRSNAADASDCLTTIPEELWFETAAPLQIQPAELWQSLTIDAAGDVVRASLVRNEESLISKFSQIGTWYRSGTKSGNGMDGLIKVKCWKNQPQPPEWTPTP